MHAPVFFQVLEIASSSPEWVELGWAVSDGWPLNVLGRGFVGMTNIHYSCRSSRFVLASLFMLPFDGSGRLVPLRHPTDFWRVEILFAGVVGIRCVANLFW